MIGNLLWLSSSFKIFCFLISNFSDKSKDESLGSVGDVSILYSRKTESALWILAISFPILVGIFSSARETIGPKITSCFLLSIVNLLSASTSCFTAKLYSSQLFLEDFIEPSLVISVEICSFSASALSINHGVQRIYSQLRIDISTIYSSGKKNN